MDKAVFFQPGTDIKELNILFEVNAEVFDLAVADNGFVGHNRRDSRDFGHYSIRDTAQGITNTFQSAKLTPALGVKQTAQTLEMRNACLSKL
jgi:hypothetical protein